MYNYVHIYVYYWPVSTEIDLSPSSERQMSFSQSVPLYKHICLGKLTSCSSSIVNIVCAHTVFKSAIKYLMLDIYYVF